MSLHEKTQSLQATNIHNTHTHNLHEQAQIQIHKSRTLNTPRGTATGKYNKTQRPQKQKVILTDIYIYIYIYIYDT